MKVDFQTANAAPVKSTFAYLNATNPSAGSYSNKLKNSADIFVKSPLSFSGTRFDNREELIESGVDGLTHTLSAYTKLSAFASRHPMPHQGDFDTAMKYFFPLCVVSSRSYAVDGEALFPSLNEFTQILKTLWNESLESAPNFNMDVYLNPALAKKSEFTRTPMIKRFVREDFARAIDVFSQDRYKHPVKNEQQLEQLAKELYNDNTIRPMKTEVSEEVVRNDEKSKYRAILEMLPGSAEEMQYLIKDMQKVPKYSVMFAEPASINERYNKQVDEYIEALAREEARNGDPYGDHRTDWEKAFDAGLY